MEIPEGRWQYACSAETFAELRNDREFAFLVTLARYTNALKYGMSVMNSQGDSSAPSADRQRHGSFLFVAGVLHELLEYLDIGADTDPKNKLCLAGLTAFVEVTRAIDGIELTEEQRRLLGVIRNRGAFHIDASVAGKVLPALPPFRLTFMAGDGRRPSAINSEFADLVTFLFMFREGAGDSARGEKEVIRPETLGDFASIRERFEALYAIMRELAARFVDTADRQLINRLWARGFRFEAVREDEEEGDAGNERLTSTASA